MKRYHRYSVGLNASPLRVRSRQGSLKVSGGRLGKIWEMANKPVSVLIISSMLITGFGKIYAQYAAEIHTKREELLEDEALQIEIKLRMDEIQLAFSEDEVGHDLAYVYNRRVLMHNCASDLPVRQGVNVSVDTAISSEVIKEIKSIVYGASPYSPSSQKYLNVNMVGLVYRLDQLRHDNLGTRLISLRTNSSSSADSGVAEKYSVIESVEEVSHGTDVCTDEFYLRLLRKYVSDRGGNNVSAGDPASRAGTRKNSESQSGSLYKGSLN